MWVSNSVFTHESRDQGQNRDLSSLWGLTSRHRSYVATGHRWSAGESLKNGRPCSHSCNGRHQLIWISCVSNLLAKGCFRALLFGNSTFLWNPVNRLYLCITPPPPSVLHDMLFILYYICERWNTLLSYSPSGCLFLFPSYLLLLSSNRKRSHFPSLTHILNPQATSSWAVNRQVLVYWRNSPRCLIRLWPDLQSPYCGADGPPLPNLSPTTY